MLVNKQYGLINLPIPIGMGNVLTTVSDRKIPHTSDNITIDYYTADITSAQDYYAFGMLMPGRNFSSDNYKFGFNGKEKDDEVSGTGNQYDYGFRIYNPRIAKFLSVDPLTKSFPMLTPYQFASNRPIDGIDLDGLEYVSVHHYANGKVAKTEFYKMTDKEIKNIGGTTAGIHNSVPYGPEGKGIVHNFYNEKGERDNSKTYWEMRQTGGTSDFEFHGLFSGQGCITNDGVKNSTNYNFNAQPIDWADAIAKRHDMDYTAVASEDYAGFLDDVRTIQADRDMVKRIDDLTASFLNPFESNGVEGVETPVRTSYSTEMDFTLLGQRILINSLVTYKQWKIDNKLGNDSKYKDNRDAFMKANPVTAKIIDQTQE